MSCSQHFSPYLNYCSFLNVLHGEEEEEDSMEAPHIRSESDGHNHHRGCWWTIQLPLVGDANPKSSFQETPFWLIGWNGIMAWINHIYKVFKLEAQRPDRWDMNNCCAKTQITTTKRVVSKPIPRYAASACQGFAYRFWSNERPHFGGTIWSKKSWPSLIPARKSANGSLERNSQHVIFAVAIGSLTIISIF